MGREEDLRPSPEHLRHAEENLPPQMEAKGQRERISRTAGPLKPEEGVSAESPRCP